MSDIGIRDCDTMCGYDTRSLVSFLLQLLQLFFSSWFDSSDEEVLEEPTQKRRFYTEQPCFRRQHDIPVAAVYGPNTPFSIPLSVSEDLKTLPYVSQIKHSEKYYKISVPFVSNYSSP